MEEHRGIPIAPKMGDRLQLERGNKRNEIAETHRSPLRFLIIILFAIFVAEVVAMIAVAPLSTRPYYQVTFVDAGIMAILIFPVLYFLSFRPLLQLIEKSQRSEERLKQVNRALTVLNECNQVLVRSEHENELLGQMCEIIVKTGGYRMAWVGFAEQDEARSVRPAAQFGFEEGYLDSAKISWGDNDRGLGPTGTAIREGVVQVNQNFLNNPRMAPWRESALARGFQSSIALPLQSENFTFGALTIYSASAESFNREEVDLLKELVSDLAFGIIALRVRLERDRAQAQIREMALFPIFNPNPVIRVDLTGRVMMANPAAEGIGLCVGAYVTDVIPSLQDVDIASCIVSGATQYIPEAYLGERILQCTIYGAPELGLAFLYSTDITERKKAEDLNRQLSRIVEQTEDTVVVTDCAGTIEYVNPAFERLTGYTKEEALGKNPKLLKSGVHDQDFYQDLWNTILNGEVFQAEIANRKKNGELFYEVKTITPLRDVQGRITHFVATGKDITEHKQDEEKLQNAFVELELRVQERTEELRLANSELSDEVNIRRQTEEALRLSEFGLTRAQEIAHLGNWELDLINNKLTWSDEVYRIFGLQPQEFRATYEAFLEAVHPEDRAAVDEAYSSSVLDGKDGYEIEHRIIRRLDNEIRIVHEKCEHFRNEAGEIVRSVGIVHDITERKRVEEALRLAHDELELHVQERTKELAAANSELIKEITERREIERRLRTQTTAMESAANGIVITDRQGNIQWTNPAFLQISGYEVQELIGRNMRIFKSGQQEESYYSQMWDTILAGEVWRGEITNQCKDGSLYVEDQTITPVRGDDGEITQFIAIKQDITERKQAEKDLRERNQKEKILTETIHTMQLDIARDLHDTIGQNISFLRMRLDHLDGKKKAIKQADMRVEIENMAKAANDSYDLMRGTLAILQSEDSTDLYRLFTRYAEQIQERSSFEMNCSSQGEPRFMSAKRMRQLFYIFREILSNIEKHAEASQVVIKMRWDFDHLHLIVSDNGKGFDVSEVPPGNHYGLKFMRDRAELLNGSVMIRSSSGSGTEVEIRLPYDQV